MLSRVMALLRDMSALLRNRVELASLELAETRSVLCKALLLAASGLLAAWFALAFWSGLLVYFAWPVLGWKILLLLAAVFSFGGLAALGWARAMLMRLELLPVTRAELRKDMDVFIK
jgi:uncharacterized membrane protein YqjE